MPSLYPTLSLRALRRLQNIIQSLFPPTVHIQDVQMLENHIHLLCLPTLSNGLPLMLKTPPRPTTALLRRERQSLETEARVFALLGQCANSCIPQLFYHDLKGGSPGSAFLSRQYIRGPTLHEMETVLTAENRRDIDEHLGFLANMIGQNVAASFGPLDKVASGTGSPFMTACIYHPLRGRTF